MRRSLHQAMIAHATDALPSEAVGLLGGDPVGEVVERVPLVNALGGRSYLADPYAQFTALSRLEAQGLVPLAVYHSHPGGGVGLSAEDIRFASALPYLQLVIALRRAHDPTVEVAAYGVTAGAVERAFLDIVEN